MIFELQPSTELSPKGLSSETEWIKTNIRILHKLCGSTGLSNLNFRLWEGTWWPSESPKRATVVLNRPSALREMLSGCSEVAVGEAYMGDAFNVEGDIVAAFELADLLADRTAGWTTKLVIGSLLSKLPSHVNAETNGSSPRLNGKQHSIKRDQEAIQFHYDVSNKFYSLWLDLNMVYSCAYFKSAEDSLETAQVNKLDTICRKLDLQRGNSLLDVGCGWGALLVHAAKHYGVNATGITLSQRQYDYVTALVDKENLRDRVTVRLLDYREVPKTEQYDKISSVGMVEHVGTANLSVYFDKVFSLLKPGGLFLNHGIGLGSHLRKNEGESFIHQHVFPDSDLQPIAEMLAASERAQFEVRDVESLREHYAKTLKQWVMRLEAHRAEAIHEIGEKSYRVWRLYMAGSAHEFLRGHLSIYQTFLAKLDDAGSVLIPPSRQQWYVERPTIKETAL